VLGLDRLLKTVDGAALLPEGLLLARARDVEHHQLALKLRELHVLFLQRLLRRLASDTLPLKRRPGVGKRSPLLLKLFLSPLAGVRYCRSRPSVIASTATLASRVAFSSSASLALCSAARARSSA
jgi:hypothetical protein